MSTRANYIFKSGRKTLATFYIHYDGYPKGAASYFQKALILGNGKIDSPSIFLRANKNCEISDIHRDIEYLYEFNIKTQMINCYAVNWSANDKMFKSPRYKEDVYSFINRHFVVFSSDDTLHEYVHKFAYNGEKGNEKRIKSENTWHHISAQDKYETNPKIKPVCLALVYKKLREATEELIDNTMNYGTKNPNYEILAAYQYNLMKQLETLTKIELNEVKEEK